MEPLYLQSEEALYFYLKKRLKAKPGAAQLDGALNSGASKKVVAVFRYSVNGKQYKLFGDVTREAIESFVQLADEQGSPAIALKEFTDADNRQGLILANSKLPNGFHCEIFTSKAADRFKKVA
jgi:hypothetical protein